MLRFVQLLMLVHFVPCAFALEPGSCEIFLRPPASELSYDTSDFEGLFLHLIAKVQTAPALEESQMDKFIGDVLSNKGELLNRARDLMGQAVRSPHQNDKMRAVQSIAMVLSALGIPLEMYGFKVEGGQASVPDMSAEDSGHPELQTKSNPIGFIKNEGATQRDLAPGLKRSVGFAAHTITRDAAPARRGGMIRAEEVQGEPNSMLIRDREKGRRYIVNVHVLRAMNGRLDGKDLQLAFNQSLREWVVIAKNLNNPDGKIGF